MVYVGKKGEGSAPEDEMRIPSQYSGNAFDADGAPRAYDPDGEALRRAEEMFRRGYVFEDEAIHSAGAETDTNSVPMPELSANTAPQKTSAAETAPQERSVTADAPARERPPKDGILSGILGSISTEEILIGALIVMLYMNGADDELLIMLVILLFC